MYARHESVLCASRLRWNLLAGLDLHVLNRAAVLAVARIIRRVAIVVALIIFILIIVVATGLIVEQRGLARRRFFVRRRGRRRGEWGGLRRLRVSLVPLGVSFAGAFPCHPSASVF